MKDKEIKQLKTIFSQNFRVVSSNEHVSGRKSYIAESDDGYILYVSCFPKWGGKMNVDIFMKEQTDDKQTDDHDND